MPACLPACSKLVLRLKSLVFLPTGKSIFLECLTRSGLRAPDGRPWSSRSVNEVLDGLAHQGLLTENLACPPALLDLVAVDAAASEDGEALVATVRRTFPAQRIIGYYSSAQKLDCEALQRLIRLAIYANDAAEFTANRGLYGKTCLPSSGVDILTSLFTTTLLAPDWLASRAPAIQVALFHAKLSAFLETGVPGPDLPSLIAHGRAQQAEEDFAAVRSALLQFDLLAGRVDRVRDGIAEIEDTSGATRLAFEGTLAFLAGRNEAALQHARAALKLHRKQAGKRKVFLDGVHGVFFLMALLRANDAALQAETQAGVDAALSSPSPYAGSFMALQALLWLAQGLEAKARELLGRLRAAMPGEPLSAACIGLAESAVDRDLARANRTDLAARFERMRDQLPLIARIHAEILAGVAEAPGPYQAYLAEAGPGLSVAFTQLIQIRQPWERALESLDAFLDSGTPKPDTGKTPRKAKRLVWFLDPETRQRGSRAVGQGPRGLDRRTCGGDEAAA